MERFYKRDNKKFRLHFSWDEYQARYCSDDAPDGNPFRHSKVFEQDAGEWIQNVRFNTVENESLRLRLLCCPQDVKRCSRCALDDERQDLCSKCEIPLCIDCAKCVMSKNAKDIPMVLANDSWWGYTSCLLFKYQVTWLEAAIFQPCWTSMLVCYVEGDEGHLLGEQGQKTQPGIPTTR